MELFSHYLQYNLYLQYKRWIAFDSVGHIKRNCIKPRSTISVNHNSLYTNSGRTFVDYTKSPIYLISNPRAGHSMYNAIQNRVPKLPIVLFFLSYHFIHIHGLKSVILYGARTLPHTHISRDKL